MPQPLWNLDPHSQEIDNSWPFRFRKKLEHNLETALGSLGERHLGSGYLENGLGWWLKIQVGSMNVLSLGRDMIREGPEWGSLKHRTHVVNSILTNSQRGMTWSVWGQKKRSKASFPGISRLSILAALITAIFFKKWLQVALRFSGKIEAACSQKFSCDELFWKRRVLAGLLLEWNRKKRPWKSGFHLEKSGVKTYACSHV